MDNLSSFNVTHMTSSGGMMTSDWNSGFSAGLTSVALFVLSLLTIVGNLLVMLAIYKDKHLQSESNYLLFSLSLADFLVGSLVMPFGAIQVVRGEWSFGATWCEIWTFVDITCCSSSILHLVSIALDRYLSVSLTRLNWSAKRNKQSIFVMIATSWLIASSVAMSPLIGWKDDGFLDRIAQKVCVVSQSISFLFFGITVTFYLPLLAILVLYWLIWVKVHSRYQDKMEKMPKAPAEISSQSEPEESGGSLSTGSTGTCVSAQRIGTELNRSCHIKSKEVLEAERVSRAARVLMIITGVFIFCWVPRFVMLPVLAMCGEACHVSMFWVDGTQWLGFSNSVLNPIIYTVFSPDFRRAFRRILKRR